ncbi:MAG: holo-ACP synthase [Campylobacter sp.]|uniref:holo-ACP synthase n=1 Tax=Campylobacter sp. TaxID=205 RepID=UPI002A7FC1B5|nr:holo-ACP synthase [Campylobacter sp.]MDY5114756.1 holo-ACP synthase [Campylobacter sp.]
MKIGIDIASITRIAKSHERLGAAFLSKFLRKSEIKILSKNSQNIAGFWAAKEAASKALGCGISKHCGFKDIKISKNKKGAPILEFSKKTRKFFKIKKASLSISHDGDFAVAVVAIKGKK